MRVFSVILPVLVGTVFTTSPAALYTVKRAKCAQLGVKIIRNPSQGFGLCKGFLIYLLLDKLKFVTLLQNTVL